MPADSESGIQLEIGHVLFMDIVGYSKLLINEQGELQHQLNDIVRGTECFRAAETAGRLVRLPVGDGMALVFFNSPEAPVNCAIEISRALKNYPRIQLRMGIHSGPVNEVRDVNDRKNIAGAGINIAQRVMDCADGGHILLSKRVAEDLGQSRQWQPDLHELGECAVKHGTSIFLVNFYTDEVGNPQLPEKLKKAQEEQAALVAANQPPPMLRRRNVVIFGAVLLVLLIGSFIYQKRSFRSSTGELIPEKSIAVLPFENFSDDKENAFFADGIQDDILTSLAKVRDLRVISRTSVMAYRPDHGVRNLREIGKALGVANVLEGSVRRQGDRVVINVQLIDTLNDRHLWANRYDRTVEDSLGLQGELATEIAGALKATLTPEEKARVERKPTRNADAWTLYLRARQLELKPDTLLQDLRTAKQLFAQAVELDPNFALAHAMLAITCADIFHFHEPVDVWKTKARTEAEIALRLQPNLSEAHQAVALCFFWFDSDYEAALREFAVAADLAPNDATVGLSIAAIRRRQGHWQDSLETFERIQKLDPQDQNIVRNILITNTAMRRWPAAAQAAMRWRAMAPDSMVAKIQSGYIDFWRKGDIHALRKVVADVAIGVDPDGVVTACRWDGAMIERDFNGAAEVLTASPLTELDYTNGGATPKTFLTGCTLLARSDQAAAQKNFAAAATNFEKAVQQSSEVAERHANLGLCYAFMGRKDGAIREGRRAVELKPESKDAFDGAIMNCYLALIYARVGEKDLAFPLIERLLKTPGAVDSVDYSITVNDLKFRWEWDPIRKDPRFDKMIADAAAAEQK